METLRFSQVLEGFSGEPSDLIPVLQKVQAAYGYLSGDALRRIARWLRMSENEVYGVATFFTQFRFAKPGEHVVRMCLGTACHVRGGEQVMDVLRRRLNVEPGEVTADGRYQLERVACLGCCALAPVLSFDDRIYGETSVLAVDRMLEERVGREDARRA